MTTTDTTPPAAIDPNVSTNPDACEVPFCFRAAVIDGDRANDFIEVVSLLDGEPITLDRESAIALANFLLANAHRIGSYADR